MNNTVKASILAAAFIIVLTSAVVSVESDDVVAESFDNGDFSGTYQIIEFVDYKVANISKYVGSDTDVVISLPMTIDGQEFYNVELEKGVFSGCSVDSVTFSVTGTNSMLSISEGAFEGISGATITVSSNYNLDTIVGIIEETAQSNSLVITKDAAENYEYEDGWLYVDGTCLAYVSSWVEDSIPKVFDSVKTRSIDNGADALGPFSNSTMTSITLPSWMTKIPNETFRGMTSLQSVTIPEGVTTVGNSAFFNTGLTSVDLPYTVTTVEDKAFYGCSELVTIDLSSALSDIHNTAFMGCGSISSITVDGQSAFSNDNIVVENDAIYVERPSGNHLMTVASDRDGTSFNVRDGTEFIDQYAFTGSKLTSIVLPESITKLENNRFEDCGSLESLDAQGVTEVSESALLGCGALENLKLAQECDTSNANLSETSLKVVEKGDNQFPVVDGATVESPISWYDESSLQPIDSVEDLQEFADIVNSGIDDFDGKTVELTNGTYDISGSEWTPIGITIENDDGTFTDHPFKGTFEGNGAIIIGLTMKSTELLGYRGMDTNYHAYGFFGGVVNGSVSGLTFTGFDIDRPGEDVNNNTVAVAVGALVLGGTVEDITVGTQEGDESVSGHSRVAGVVGYIGGAGNSSPLIGGGDNVSSQFTVKGNVNHADIATDNHESSYGTAAGIVATANIKDSTGGSYEVSGNTNNGAVTGYYAAGIIASDFCPNTAKTVSGNTNNGAVTSSSSTGPGSSATGIMTNQSGTTASALLTLTNNTNNGAVTSLDGTATGIIGTIYCADVSGNMNTGHIDGFNVAAGIVATIHSNASGNIVTNVNGNANSGAVEVRNTEDTYTSGSNSYDVIAAGIVGNMTSGVFGETMNTSTGAVSGQTMNVGKFIGVVSSGDVYGLKDSADLGTVKLSGGLTVTFHDCQLGNVEFRPAHNQSSLYTIGLAEGSSIGSISGSGKVHTGVNMKISGGTVDSLMLEFSNNDGAGTTFNLVVADNAAIGRVDVVTNEYYMNVATESGSSIGSLTTDANVRVGASIGTEVYSNQGTVGAVFTDKSVTMNSSVTGDGPELAVYVGTDTSRFTGDSTENIGLFNAVSSDSFDGTIDEDLVLRNNVSLLIMPESTLTVSAAVTGTIVGYDETSRMTIAEGGSYNSMSPGTYTWDTEEEWSESYVASYGDDEYTTLEAAFEAAKLNGGTVTLLSDVYDVKTLTLDTGKQVTIELNGFDIFFDYRCSFRITHGSLELQGAGTVSESEGRFYYSPVILQGSSDPQNESYSTVDVGPEVILRGWSGIFIDVNEAKHGYGVVVDFYGTVVSERDDVGAAGHGIYINGQIKDVTGNVPIIRTYEGSSVTSVGNGVYAAGYAEWHLAGDVTGMDALSIKSGTFEITGGTYTANGEYADPADANSNGSENTGAAVSITSNDGYASKSAATVVKITGGTFISENGHAFYEGIAVKSDGSSAASKSAADIDISGGSYTSAEGKAAVSVTKAEDKNVISGGTFSTDVSRFCVDGYATAAGPDGTYGLVPEFQYTIIDGNAVLTKYNGIDAVIIIPESATVDGQDYDVIAVAEGALLDRMNLKLIIAGIGISSIPGNLPQGVTVVGLNNGFTCDSTGVTVYSNATEDEVFTLTSSGNQLAVNINTALGTVLSSNGVETSYQWFKDNTPITDATQYNITATDDGMYHSVITFSVDGNSVSVETADIVYSSSGSLYDVTFDITSGDSATPVNGSTIIVTDSDGNEYRVDVTISLPAGSYNYTVSCNGFEDGKGSFTVENTGQTISVNLTKIFTKITITQIPENPLIGQTVTVSVGFENLEPGVEVTYDWNGVTSSSYGATEFSFEAANGTYVLTVSCHSYGADVTKTWTSTLYYSPEVEVTVSFPEATGIGTQTVQVERGTSLNPGDIVSPDGYVITGFLRNGAEFSGPLVEDEYVLTAVVMIDAGFTVEQEYNDGYTVLTATPDVVLDGALYTYVLLADDGEEAGTSHTGIFEIRQEGTYSIEVSATLTSDSSINGESQSNDIAVQIYSDSGVPLVNVPFESVTGYMGGTETIDLDVTISEGASATYESSNTEVVVVDDTGVVSFVGVGESTVTVRAILPSTGEMTSVQVRIVVEQAPEVDGITFNPVTDVDYRDALERLYAVSEIPDRAFEDGDLKMFDLTGTSGAEFTITYSDLGWSYINGSNWDDYDYYLVHFPEGGYDIPRFEAGSEGITVHSNGFSPYVFIAVEKQYVPTPEPEPTPMPGDDDSYVTPPVVYVDKDGGSDAVGIIACAAAACAAAIIALFAIFEYRKR